MNNAEFQTINIEPSTPSKESLNCVTAPASTDSLSTKFPSPIAADHTNTETAKFLSEPVSHSGAKETLPNATTPSESYVSQMRLQLECFIQYISYCFRHADRNFVFEYLSPIRMRNILWPILYDLAEVDDGEFRSGYHNTCNAWKVCDSSIVYKSSILSYLMISLNRVVYKIA